MRASVVGAAMVGYDGHRGWVNYLAVDESRRGEGLGAAIMAEAERLLVERGCPKLNLQVRSTNQGVIDWYRSLGYEPDHAVSLGKRLIPDGVDGNDGTSAPVGTRARRRRVSSPGPSRRSDRRRARGSRSRRSARSPSR